MLTMSGLIHLAIIDLKAGRSFQDPFGKKKSKSVNRTEAFMQILDSPEYVQKLESIYNGMLGIRAQGR